MEIATSGAELKSDTVAADFPLLFLPVLVSGSLQGIITVSFTKSNWFKGPSIENYIGNALEKTWFSMEYSFP